MPATSSSTAVTTTKAFDNISKAVITFGTCLCCVIKKKTKTEHDPKNMWVCCGPMEGEFKSKKDHEDMQSGCVVCSECAMNDAFEGGRDSRTMTKWCRVCAKTKEVQAAEYREKFPDKRIPTYIANRAYHVLKQPQPAAGAKQISAIAAFAETGRDEVSTHITKIEKERDTLLTKMERMEARQSEESQQQSQQDSVVQQLERAQIDEPSEQRAA